jgi:hypothetical protein
VKELTQRAILIRVGLAILLHFFVDEYTFAPDQVVYHATGASLADYWAGATLVYPTRMLDGSPTGYYYVLGVMYSVFGQYALLPKIFNAILGGLTVPIVYDVALRVTGTVSAALRVARYTVLFPSLILWSALNIRDAWIIMLILLICREAHILQERFSPRALFFIVVAILAITQFRSYIFVAVTGPMIVSFAVRHRRHLVRNVFLGMVVALVVIYGDQAGGSNQRLRGLDLEQIQYYRYWNSVGAKSGFEQVDISTPGKALLFLPVGLAYFLLAPFPWMISGIRQLLTVPEILFLYWLIPHIIRGIRTLVRERLSHTLMILLMVGGLTFGYALGEGNAGTAYRHRAQIIVFFLMFAAAGIDAKERKLQKAQLAFARRIA